VAEKGLAEFKDSLHSIHQKYGFPKKDLEKYCLTKIRVWVNNIKTRNSR